MKIVKYYCDLCGEEITVNDIAEVSISCTWNIDYKYNKELITCFDCWSKKIRNVCDNEVKNVKCH